MRIILADDHVMLREGLRPFVEKLAPDTVVQEAGSFTEALAQIEANPAVDLVILDIKMPGMNGFQGLTTVKARFPAIRCVILSAMADRDHVLEAMRLGADGFIPKHLSGGAMVSALQLVISGERFIPSMLMESSAPQSSGDKAGSGDVLGRLTPRERDILNLLREGLPNKVIAARLDVSEVTVKSHLGNMFRKLGVQNRLQAMRILVDTESL